jgi:hypothetical protein
VVEGRTRRNRGEEGGIEIACSEEYACSSLQTGIWARSGVNPAVSRKCKMCGDCR